MKHNWTRPIVKFIEDDIVASGIGGATGPARFFAARAAGLIGDGANKTFGSGDTRTWSAWDNMYIRRQGTKRQRIIRRKYTRVPRGRMMLRRRKFTRRARPTFRRKVRRAVLGAAESKRHVTVVSQELIDDVTLDKTRVSGVPLALSTYNGLEQKNSRVGTSIWMRGLGSVIHVQNQVTQPLVVHMIWWYKTKNAVGSGDDIFKDPALEQTFKLADYTSYWEKMAMQLGNRTTRILKHVTVTLAEKEAGTLGMDSKQIKVWIPLNRTCRFNLDATTQGNQDYDIQFGCYCYNKEGSAITTGGGAGAEDVMLLQQRHCLYFKDP